MTESRPRIPQPVQPPSAEQTSRLLRLSMDSLPRPIDDLLDRLTAPDGSSWLAHVLSTGPGGAYGPPEVAIQQSVSLEQLRSIKEAGTDLAVRGRSGDARLAAMTSYFFAVAAGLARFDENLTSRESDELDEILRDLAAVVPPNWTDMFDRALSALHK